MSFEGSRLFSGGMVKKKTVDVVFEPEKLGVTDGKGLLRIAVRDYSWRNWWKGNVACIEREVLIDTVPPQIAVLSRAHNVAVGGSGVLFYRLSEPCPTSGVRVGETFFPGHPGLFADKLVHTVFFALPHDGTKSEEFAVEATDYAGNTSRAGFPHHVIEKRFKQDRIRISDRFLNWKMPEFKDAVPAGTGDSNLDIFLAVNRKLREENFRRIMEIVEKSEPVLMWEGPFLRLPNSARRSSFADHRIYRYRGREIDRQVHLGIDLASVAHKPVPAANHGKIIFAGSIGIYGQTVMIDHGFGLVSMYAHLSSLSVREGRMVKKGDIVGRTGTTGLAGGDHLHFSILVHKTFVNPVEWWDGHWIHDNVTAKLHRVRMSYPAGDG